MRLLPLAVLSLALSAPGFAQEGRWFDLATGGASASAGPASDQALDPHVLYDLAGTARAAAMDLERGLTDAGVRERQRHVEDRLTALIGMLEREGG